MTMTMKDQSSDCPVLRLPAELRNNIYELVFKNINRNSNRNIDVAEAFFPTEGSEIDAATRARKADVAPPSSALLRCSRQFHDEGKGIFAAAYQRYWRKTFTIRLKDMEPFERFTTSVPWRTIQNFIVTARVSRTTVARVNLDRCKGDWRMIWMRDLHSQCDNYNSEQGEMQEVANTEQLAYELGELVFDSDHPDRFPEEVEEDY